MDIETLLRHFLLSDNDTRKRAEAALNALRPQRDELPLQLTKVIRTCAEVDLKMLAAVLLRKVVKAQVADAAKPGETVSHWDLMSAPARSFIQGELLKSLQEEPVVSVRRKVCDTVGVVAFEVLNTPDGAWPELWALMNTFTTSSVPVMQEAGLMLIEMLGAYIADNMQTSLGTFTPVLLARLTDAAAPLEVRVGAARAAISILGLLGEKSTYASAMAPLISPILALLQTVVAAADEDTKPAIEIAGGLQDVVTGQPQLFKPYFADAVNMLCAFASNTELENDVRALCIELAMAMGEAAPATARKMGGAGYLGAVLPVLMLMLTEHGEDPPSLSEWENLIGIDVDLDCEGCNVPIGEEGVCRVAEAIGTKKFVPAVSSLVAGYLNPAAHPGPDGWKYRHAGLAAIGSCAHIVGDSEAELGGIAGLAAAQVRDPDPRVRYGAMHVISQYCHFKAPCFHTLCGPTVIGVLLTGLRDSCKRVRAQACLSVPDFFKHMDVDFDEATFGSSVKDFMGALFAILSHDDMYVQELALVAITSITEAARHLMDAYYDTIVAGVKTILSAPDLPVAVPDAEAANNKKSLSPAARRALAVAQRLSRSQRMLKGRALECISTLGTAVGPERFRGDAFALMSLIVPMLAAMEAERNAAEASGSASALAGDDPIPSFLWEAVGRVAKALGPDEFETFVPAVFPPLLREAARESVVVDVVRPTDQAVTGEDDFANRLDDDDDDDEDDGVLAMEQGDGVVVKVKTSAVEERGMICGTLATLCARLNPSTLVPHIGTLMSTSLSLLKLAGSPYDEIKAAGAQIVRDVIVAAASTLNAGEVGAALASSNALLASVVPPGTPATLPALDHSETMERLLAAQPQPLPQGVGYLRMVWAALDSLMRNAKDEDALEMLKLYVTSINDLLKGACNAEHFLGAAKSDPADGPASSASSTTLRSTVHVLRADQLVAVTNVLLQLRQGVIQRRAVRVAEAKIDADDLDEEALEALKDEQDMDEELHFYVVDTLGTLIKTHTTAYMPVYNTTLAPIIAQMNHPECIPADRRNAAYVFIDVLEYCSEVAVNPASGKHYADEYLPVLIHGAAHTDSTLRQACLYGIGAAAVWSRPEIFLPHAGAALMALNKAMREPLDPAAGVSAVEENAVASLGKIITHVYGPHQVPPGMPTGFPTRGFLISGYLSALPFKFDQDEARQAMLQVCGWLEEGDADVVGPAEARDPVKLAKVLGLLGATLRSKMTLTPSLATRIGKAVAALQASYPPAVLADTWGRLSEEDRTSLSTAAAAAAAGAN